MSDSFHATTIVCVRRDGKVVIGGDGQVTLGNIVAKANARKLRRLGKDGAVIAGFAGATADAFTLFELFEAKLDKHGNSVRGIKVCKTLSAHYDLHMLNRSDDARHSIIADYNIGKNPSRRVRRPQEQEILARHFQEVRVIELVGTLSYMAPEQASADPQMDGRVDI